MLAWSLFLLYMLAWNSDVIRTLFSGRDAQLILSIPLPKSTCVDKRIWSWDQKGRYSVKSGYRVLQTGGDIVSSPPCTNWTEVWKRSVPPKVINFLWRSLSGCLPCLYLLRSRQIEVETLCPMCSNAEETDVHVLVKCSVAKSIWAASIIGDHSDGITSIANWWNKLRRRCTNDQLDLAAMQLWCIWLNRNNRVWKKKLQPSGVVVQEAERNFQLWKVARHQHFLPQARSPSHNSRWQKPAIGFKKCNVDAGLFPVNGKVGYGCVVRDDIGSFVAGMQGSMIGFFSPAVAEAIGIREALSWLKYSGIDQVVIESDALGVINALNNAEPDDSGLGVIINDCKVLQREFSCCLFFYVPRSANCVVHVLARASCSVSGQVGWIDSPPLIISDVLAYDVI